jgi:pyruvate dehydrogenase E2 component (dihydrolipoamide acetyltransferase)
MATEVFMPQLGMTMTEGLVARWLKQEGEQVFREEALFEVETDKVVMEVKAASDGILAGVRAAKGDTVRVGEVMAYILAPGENLPLASVGAPRDLGGEGTHAPATSVAGPSSAALLWVAGAGALRSILPISTTRKTLKASPRARRLARQSGIDLRALQGTGPAGRIVEADVRRAIPVITKAPAVSPVARRLADELGVDLNRVHGTGPGGRVTKADVEQAADLRPLHGIRKVVADRMAFSASTVPHFHLTVEVEASMLLRMREQLIPDIEAETKVRLTFTDLLVVLIARTLRHHPEVNVTWADGAVRFHRTVGVGIATATNKGLVVPVIHDADKKSLAEITARRWALTEQARAGSLGLQDLEGGTFTLTNLGMYGVDIFDPIINTPQSSILSVGRVRERPWAISGQLVIQPTMYYTLAVDHRLLDGAQAAQFLDTLVRLTEDPYLLANDLFPQRRLIGRST